MQYRALGRTALSLSAVGLGGHWKGLETALGPAFHGSGYSDSDFDNIRDPAFLAARTAVVERCLECGVNYVDACSPQEILAYSRILRELRAEMHLGFSWHTREPRCPEWRTADRLIEGLRLSLREAALDSVSLWRISLPMEHVPDDDTRRRIEEATVIALDRARASGLARATGVSAHSAAWLTHFVNSYPEQIQVVLFPWTGVSSALPASPLWQAVKRHQTGVLGIKPFGGGALFASAAGPSEADPQRQRRMARLALRSVLSRPALTGTLPGLITTDQVADAVAAATADTPLDELERAELSAAGAALWTGLPAEQAWLSAWREI